MAVFQPYARVGRMGGGARTEERAVDPGADGGKVGAFDHD
jgi:hypothetical protein